MFSRSLNFEITKYSKALITLDFIYFFILREFCAILHRRILYECIKILELQKFENLRISKKIYYWLRNNCMQNCLHKIQTVTR